MLAILVSLSGAWAQTDGSSESSDIKVDRLVFPVTLTDGQTYSVVGYLYYRGSFQNRPLQVLVHGATYNHGYWDMSSINGHDYSYAHYMADRRYAVLAIDQLGSGESSRPDGDLLTLKELASSVNQVLSQLRTGALGCAFHKIALVGHSFGASTSIYTQAAYKSADALVVTGLGHVPHELPISAELVYYLLQFSYFPLTPDFRTALFYSVPHADQAVIDWDNATFQDMISRGQLLTVFLTLFAPASNRVGDVSGPVLVQLGEYDAMFPSALAEGEAAFWTSTSSLTVQSLPNMGHDFNSHLDNHRGWEQIDDWLTSTLGW